MEFSDGAAKKLMGSRGGGKSSVVKGTVSGKGFVGAPGHGKGVAGTKRFDLSDKSLNRGRKI